MKILPIEKVREADDFTIKNEPVKSINLMERAATQCYKWIIKNIDKKHIIKIFCGLGNNGGDGLVVARLLADKKYKIELFIVRYSDKCSKDFKINFER
ncbi:MAG: bifunctional ADP-dependent NAD(P)H-hydrate dehydratase/NAD(P)H-hydrate epimerase, partial [Bacteroidales bacterium]|nr:bifunctional ADP-dependent NAD(P)H-hydrate dehydratase/NAD(P)H-hydrate epimerase [Bacteroidales bacterium]